MAGSRDAISSRGHECPVLLPPPLTTEWEWQRLANCRDHDGDLFFAGEATEEQAKSICAVCPVIMACRDHAMSANEPDGVWGGLTPSERMRLRWGYRDGKRLATG
ncbi:WhiB family transcriptional regulator (plasmid) [Rhodococcus rhodochrous]|uniref:WhiB family transcriptional regulator n=1 Tax=Rhodococcus rhodochrous TaxID=1829 RepID=UPI00132F0366|nr:WhiB family transcriptional regulator [Rhodococcus rhodochrous]QHG85511.1 WhiB family transcriptional regulator [Rhodococcus rhodochrous]